MSIITTHTQNTFIRQASVSLLDASREPVSDVAAVYFMVAEQGNVNRVCRDLSSHIYDTYHFNFISPISRPLLEELAKTTVDANSVSEVSKACVVVFV